MGTVAAFFIGIMIGGFFGALAIALVSESKDDKDR